MLLHLFHQSLHFSRLRNIGGHGNRFALRVGQGIQSGTSLLTGLRFSGRDEDLGAASLSETVWKKKKKKKGLMVSFLVVSLLLVLLVLFHPSPPSHACIGTTHPDAAWRPSPRDPPVMTATLPCSEKMFLKSWSLTSASADMLGGRLCFRCYGVDR